tara:strand:- start:4181 stop:4843 length:663 start_codon:yes stop_codon:yes gene_type:complete
MNSHQQSIIVCGTDTDIGKTVVSALLVQGLNAFYWKPIQSGLLDDSDSNTVSKILNLPQERIISELYKFKTPVSPHWAAEKEKKWIDPNSLKLPIRNQPLIIETAGGLMVPINRDLLQINLIQKWNLPVVLVAKSGLGTLNHTLLSLEALKKREIPILGIILNGEIHQDNPKTLEQFGKIPIIAQLPRLKELSSKTLQKQWDQQSLKITFQKYVKIEINQ